MILTVEVATHTDVMRIVSGEMSVQTLQEQNAQIGGKWTITREEPKNDNKIFQSYIAHIHDNYGVLVNNFDDLALDS